jgi:hypothetical protein
MVELDKEPIMHAYRFRLLSGVNEDFIRDVEVKSTQSFQDFHDIIREVSEFEGDDLASFFICDRKWSKLNEITLIDMGTQVEEIGDDNYDDDDDEMNLNYNMPTSVMSDSLIKDFIDDPHQRILYEYDILNEGIIYIELLKIAHAVEDVAYPVCITSKGSLFSREKSKEDINPEDIDEEELLKEFEDMLNGKGESNEYDIFAEE